MQLELAFYPPTSVRGCLAEYLAMVAESVTEETIRDDYSYRAVWCCEQFGETTPIVAVTFARMECVARAARGVLRDVTIRRRLNFYRAAVKYAAQRGLVLREAIPDLPPWLKDDSVRCEDFYTPEQFERLAAVLPPVRFHRYARLAFWTGQHTADLFTMRRSMLETDHRWCDNAGACVSTGRWWRRNHKNKRCTGAWMPMEPELLALAGEVLGEPGAPDDTIVGRVWNLKRALDRAADAVELPRVRANLGLRASHATMLASRGYSYEYIRQILGHEGEVRWGATATPRTARPTTLSRHYLRPSGALFSSELARRKA